MLLHHWGNSLSSQQLFSISRNFLFLENIVVYHCRCGILPMPSSYPHVLFHRTTLYELVLMPSISVSLSMLLPKWSWIYLISWARNWQVHAILGIHEWMQWKIVRLLSMSVVNGFPRYHSLMESVTVYETMEIHLILMGLTYNKIKEQLCDS
jgi:hypothetical protein